MDYKKSNAPTNTVTRNMMELCEDTGNVYETVAIIGKRANQIAVEMKNGIYILTQKCTKCGHIRRNKVCDEDNFDAVIALSKSMINKL